ncbi:hypothetical protein DESPIGER_2020 [Desulfovibrio piger]|uniref:Uncharacterized protein n=1 Tax=Desulfovibrio piger TaxID=901 RepID=A0A1K1LGK0_9BACT|nr:hypothetical protein DESPIGER_2020 [Desulfovibrio piger]
MHAVNIFPVIPTCYQNEQQQGPVVFRPECGKWRFSPPTPPVTAGDP